MGYSGVNGWYYDSMANYYGRNLALPMCKDCRFLKKESGSVGSFGNFSYKCNADTGCAASQMGQGKMVSTCSSYDKATEDKNKGKFGIGAGLSTIGSSFNKDGSMNADKMVVGAGKVAIGAAVLVGTEMIEGGKALGKLAKKVAKELSGEAEYERHIRILQEITFDEEENEIDYELDSVFDVLESCQSESCMMDLKMKKDLYESALEIAKYGIDKLDNSDFDKNEMEKYHKKFIEFEQGKDNLKENFIKSQFSEMTSDMFGDDNDKSKAKEAIDDSKNMLKDSMSKTTSMMNFGGLFGKKK